MLTFAFVMKLSYSAFHLSCCENRILATKIWKFSWKWYFSLEWEWLQNCICFLCAQGSMSFYLQYFGL